MLPTETDAEGRPGAYAGLVIEEAHRLHAALAAGLPGFLDGRLAELGVDPGAMSDEVAAALAAVTDRLRDQLALPFDLQRATPLEVVRSALTDLGSVLDGRGVARPVPESFPDDPFGLAPSSAGELGEEALDASLRWGVAKARFLARPVALVVSSNLMDRSPLEAAASEAGYRVVASRSAHGAAAPLVAFVDLELAGADAVIRELAAGGVTVVAYGPHVDDHALVRARALGAAAAEPRSRLFRNPAAYLPPLV